MAVGTLDLNLDKLDFRDRFGEWRSTYGCSILGRSQFHDYLDQCYEIIKTTDLQSLAELYQQHERFRHCCDRCLELNYIDPDCLDGGGALLQSLLFSHEEGPGMLVTLNAIDLGRTDGGDVEGSPEANMGAALMSSLESFSQAMDALEHPRGKLLMQILKARDDAMKAAQDKVDGKKGPSRKWVEETRKKGVKIDMRKPGG